VAIQRIWTTGWRMTLLIHKDGEAAVTPHRDGKPGKPHTFVEEPWETIGILSSRFTIVDLWFCLFIYLAVLGFELRASRLLR
jgi:hypothetical protein